MMCEDLGTHIVDIVIIVCMTIVAITLLKG